MKQPKDIDVRAYDFISNLMVTDKYSPYFTRVELG